MKNILLKTIKLYQKTISPDHGSFQIGAMRCRFYPSCSQYAHDAIGSKGIVKGIAVSFYRILRCNPFSAGGVDFVSEDKKQTLNVITEAQ